MTIYESERIIKLYVSRARGKKPQEMNHVYKALNRPGLGRELRRRRRVTMDVLIVSFDYCN